jgi:hypothetical protein
MNIRPHKKSSQGVLMMDLAMAIIILSLAIFPLAFSFAQERDAMRADYFRAAADEVVDGEMEVLAAGDWKNYPDGTHSYTVQSPAAAGLPAGNFELTKAGKRLRLEWMPKRRQGIGIVTREITVP